MTKKPSNNAFNWPVFSRILKYLKSQRWLVATILIVVLFIAIISQLLPQLQRIGIDQYIQPVINSPLNGLKTQDRLSGLLHIMLVYLVLLFIRFGFNYLFEYNSTKLSQNILRSIKLDVFKKLQRLSLSFFDKNSVGLLINRIGPDVEGIKMSISAGLIPIVQSILILITILINMLILNWQLAIIVVVSTIILSFISRFFQSNLRRSYSNANIARGRFNSMLNENIVGMLTIQLFNRQKRIIDRFLKRSNNLLQADLKVGYWLNFIVQVMIDLLAIVMAIVIWYGGGQAIQGLITLGTLLAFIEYFHGFHKQINGLSQIMDYLQSAVANAEHIFTLLDEPETITDPINPHLIDHFKGEIEFRDVWFSYKTDGEINDEDWVLKNISFKINPGESIALVGATGAGKSSIISLIPRFYDVQQGQVLVDGINVEQYKQADIRKHISIVLQDVILSVNTLENNLRLSNKDISLEQIIEICKLVGIHDFIDGLPDGYQTTIQERGSNFSTGQKQLLAFARALIHNPDGLLILDEATANIDSLSEEKIQQAINQLTKHRTSIIIAHRLSTIQHCDRIIVLKHGQIVEEGSHEELLLKNDYYSTLYKLQYYQKEQLEIA